MVARFRRFLRLLRRTGQDNDAWPVILLVVAVLVPALGLVWFMSAAMQNERWAARQKLIDAYRGQLEAAQVRWQEAWQSKTREVDDWAQTLDPADVFSRSVRSTWLDSVVVLDRSGRIVYPFVPAGTLPGPGHAEHDSTEASRLEFLRRDFAGAAAAYEAMARQTTNIHDRPGASGPDSMSGSG